MSPFFFIIAMISCTVAANLMMKLGSADPASSLLFGLISLRTFCGLVIFGGAAALYAFVLRMFPLNVVQAFAAAQFIAVVCASAFILGEPMSIWRWLGVTLIAAGIAIVAIL